MAGNESLREYLEKRDLSKSTEPAGGEGGGSGRRPIFVIHKHDASRLHYDFRLEIDGVLKSWAVPKGPSTDPADKRLAVHVEDHPVEYADFEGVIPEDEYGGGTVMVWDTGPYRNLRADKGDDSQSMSDSFADGQIEVWLEGGKLTGGYVLVHTKMGGDEENWMLKKMDDAAADARRNPTSTEPQSVKTGRTLEEIAEQEEPQTPDV